jgi:hypothetical protein
VLYTFLHITIKVLIQNLETMGDLKLVIDQAGEKNATKDIILAPIMREIKVTF